MEMSHITSTNHTTAADTRNLYGRARMVAVLL